MGGSARPASLYAIGAFVLLGIALLIALGFEFVNGFHDTANAVATVIYTQQSAAACRGCVVGSVQFPGRDGLIRRCRLRRATAFYQATERAQAVFAALAAGATVPSATAARAAVTDAVQTRQIAGLQTWAALDTLSGDIATQVRAHGEMNAIPAAAVPNVRNDMYLVSEAIRLAQKTALPAQDIAARWTVRPSSFPYR